MTYADFASAGALNYCKSLYTPDEWDTYYHLVRNDAQRDGQKWSHSSNGTALTDAGRKRHFVNDWGTWQMSDHLPLWVALKIDFSEQYLQGISR